MGCRWPAVGSGALSVAVCAWDLLKEVAIIFIKVVPGPSVFHSREPGVSGNFRGRIKGAKYRFPFQDGTWDFPGDAVAGKGLIL